MSHHNTAPLVTSQNLISFESYCIGRFNEESNETDLYCRKIVKKHGQFCAYVYKTYEWYNTGKGSLTCYWKRCERSKNGSGMQMRIFSFLSLRDFTSLKDPLMPPNGFLMTKWRNSIQTHFPRWRFCAFASHSSQRHLNSSVTNFTACDVLCEKYWCVAMSISCLIQLRVWPLSSMVWMLL